MDKKNIIALALSSLLGASQVQAERTTNTSPQKDATTQTFKQLWKNVEQHRRKDLPKSALKAIHAIRQKALGTHDTPQLIAAMLSTYQLEKEISPDSTQKVIEEMERFCAAEMHPVPRALWHSVLGQVLNQESSVEDIFGEESVDNEAEVLNEALEGGEEAGEQAKTPFTRSLEHFRAAFQDIPALATAKIEDYEALFNVSPKAATGIDHKLLVALLQDLFEIENYHYKRPFSVTEYVGLLEKSRDLFLKNQEERAALQAEILILQAKGDSYLENFTSTLFLNNDEKTDVGGKCTFVSQAAALEAVEKVLARYGHLPEAGKVAVWQCHLMVNDEENLEMQLPKVIALAQEYTKKYVDYAHELKNFINEQTHPTFEVSWADSKEMQAGRALYPETEVVLPVKFRNVQKASVQLYRLSNISANELEKADASNHVQQRLQQILKKNGAQVPLFTKQLRPSPAPIYEEREDSISFQAPKSGLYLMRLTVDGWYDRLAPCYVSRGQRLLFNSASRHQDAPEYLVVDQRSGEEINNKADLDALPEIAELPFWMQRKHTPLNLKLEHSIEVYTDREVYRPNQMVEASALLYSQDKDAYQVLPNARVKARLLDTDGKEVKAQTTISDEMGVVSTRFMLPKYCKPGHFKVEFALVDDNGYPHSVNNAKSFRVEEYKRPNFSVKLDDLTRKLALSDSVRFEGVAETFAGLPVANAVLKWKLNFDSWYFYHSGNKGGMDRSLKNRSGETKTDENGRFSIPVDWTFEDKSALNLNFSVEVVAPDGEVQSTNFNQWISPRTETEEEQQQKPLFEVKYNDTEDEAQLTINGSGRLFLRLVSTNRGVIERKSLAVKDGFTQTFQWKEQDNLGDAVTAYLYLLKDGEFHTKTITVTRPHPDKRLQLSWSTFRSQLTPGQYEEWQLHVTYPDGKPADANVIARLYDASLDAFLNPDGTAEKDPWKFQYLFPREEPSGDWYHPNVGMPSFYPRYYYEPSYDKEQPSVTWRGGLFDYYLDPQLRRDRITVCADYAMPVAEFAMDGGKVQEARSMPLKANRTAKAEQNGDSGDASNAVRKNFAETAYFNPTLRTDAEGKASISFILPSSLTEWTFNAFAFDRTLNSGTLTDKVVARKQLNAQVATPRFLREGDRMQWPVSLYNRSEQSQKGNLYLDIIDASTRETLQSFSQPYDLEAGKSLTQQWEWEVPMGCPGIDVRVMAKAENFSDGEEHEISILPRDITMTVAEPFMVRGREDITAKTEKAKAALMARLGNHKDAKIEVAAERDVSKEVADLVPKWMQVLNGSAYDQAVNLYGIQYAMSYALRPLVSLSDSELQAYRQSAYDRLKAEQTSEGGWSWYPGMKASPYITSQIAILLARANRPSTAYPLDGSLLQAAMKFLDKEMTNRMAECKQKKLQPYVGETEINYLYLCHLLDNKETPTIRYWRNQMSKDDVYAYTMYGKAVQAQILAKTKYKELAKTALQSVIEHTVASPDMGRYFDTQRALSGYASYRIPTQVMTLEALHHASDETLKPLSLDREDVINEMYLWLLQSKRTQVWNNSRATTDAAYSLLTTRTFFGLSPTWGAVEATYTASPEEIAAQGSGFKLQRSLQVLRDGKWKTLSGKQKNTLFTLKVGDHVRWVYTLKAERDFDHVALKSTRPAALESKNPFSGMTWMNGLSAYRMVRDAENEYFFEHLAKGKYTFYDEMVVMRAGAFSGGVATVQCTFAPEFVGNSSAVEVEVKR